MVANGKGLMGTSHRAKERESKLGWTGRSPVVRRCPLNHNHAEYIGFVADCWAQAEFGVLAEYAGLLRREGFGDEVVQSILAQGTQGMPGRRKN
jgi:hypothetical protein